MDIALAGIDPGVVDTGIVRLVLHPATQEFEVMHAVFKGLNPKPVADWLNQFSNDAVFIENFRVRSGFEQNNKMIAAVAAMQLVIPHSRLIDNMGSRAVLKPGLMSLLQLTSFPATHHGDLEAAARIMIFGALKIEEYNQALYQVVHDHVEGNSWTRI